MDVPSLRQFYMEFEKTFNNDNLKVQQINYLSIKDFVNHYRMFVSLITGIQMEPFETTHEKEKNYTKAMKYYAYFYTAYSRINQLLPQEFNSLPHSFVN